MMLILTDEEDALNKEEFMEQHEHAWDEENERWSGEAEDAWADYQLEHQDGPPATSDYWA